VFLIIYDFFLKRETFFQWNRVYLIGSYAFSLILPWIKIEAFKTDAPTIFNGYAEFLWNLDQSAMLLASESAKAFNFSWQETLLFSGATLATIWFGIKIWCLLQLRKEGSVHYFKNFTRILVPESSIAFSFFKSIFLGEKVPEREYDSIISHELVHIRQWHSLDLLFFELMRIANWFNPLVYVYQNRIAELHEFIADAQVPKTEREAHYELLLSQAFQTQNISFVNQFFKSSLIKKRIVMLKKSKSKKVWQLKYLVLVPLVLGMLFYTSCNQNETEDSEKVIEATELKESTETVSFGEIDEVPIFPNCENEEDKRACFNKMMQQHISKNFRYPKKAQELGIQGRVNTIFTINKDGFIENLRMRGLDTILENEVSRIISKLPKMIPGKQSGEAVNVPFSIPITFKLNTEKRPKIILEENWSKPYSKIYPPLNDNQTYFETVEKKPIYPGCVDVLNSKICFYSKLNEHIRKNFNYPKEAIEKGLEGQVDILFNIDINGKINNISAKGPDVILEEEAKRIIRKLPKMQPGQQNGQDINVIYSIPITFKLD
jgi:TonB family protein